MLMAIWAVIGVQFFHDFDQSERYFNNFATAYFTMFQIMTGDSWAAICRALMYEQDKPWSVIFYVTYIIVIVVIFLNVVVAVLLDSYLEVDTGDDQQELHPYIY